jgi:hypothetical protein
LRPEVRSGATCEQRKHQEENSYKAQCFLHGINGSLKSQFPSRLNNGSVRGSMFSW